MTGNDSLADRIRSEAAIASRSGQLGRLEAIAAEVGAVLAERETFRLQVEQVQGQLPPCDGGCSYYTGPEETCSAHGRPVAEVWEIANRFAEERDQLARLHEVATERVVGYAAVIEQADALVSRGTVNAVQMHTLLRSADTDAALREVRAKALEDAAADWHALVMREKPPIVGASWLIRRAAAIRAIRGEGTKTDG